MILVQQEGSPATSAANPGTRDMNSPGPGQPAAGLLDVGAPDGFRDTAATEGPEGPEAGQACVASAANSLEDESLGLCGVKEGAAAQEVATPATSATTLTSPAPSGDQLIQKRLPPDNARGCGGAEGGAEGGSAAGSDCHIEAGHDATRSSRPSRSQSGGGGGQPHAKSSAGSPGAASSARAECELLNAIEAKLGPAIQEHFELYLRAIGITVTMGRSVEDTRRLMARHLRDNRLLPAGDDKVPDAEEDEDASSSCWKIIKSPLGGRGVVATRTLHAGDLVLVDAPLVLGPRAGNENVVCVGCLQPRHVEDLHACPHGCRLPVCRGHWGCEDAASHRAECALLRSWGVKGDASEWSSDLLRASAAVRCLGLPPDQREILASMQSHQGRQHAFEVELLLEALEGIPKPEEERFMRLACCVMDANAFRMTLPDGDDGRRRNIVVRQPAPLAAPLPEEAEETKPDDAMPCDPQSWGPAVGVVRGLYPLGALLNHACTPNTRHAYDARGFMVVRAARTVLAGEELTVTYSGLLWGSPARRQHLLRTKHFLCSCERCKDATEGSTCLAALPCPARLPPGRTPCPGPLLPAEPLSLTGSWRCRGCGLHVPADRVTLLQSVLGGLLRSLYLDPAHLVANGPATPPPPDVILNFLAENQHILPATNHITVELKADVVWALGHKPGLAFPELSAELLQLKEGLIRELLSVLQALRAGRCSLVGLLNYELHCTLMERVRRDSRLLPSLAVEALDAVETAFEVLGEDNSAPADLRPLLQRARSVPRETTGTGILPKTSPSTAMTLPLGPRAPPFPCRTCGDDETQLICDIGRIGRPI